MLLARPTLVRCLPSCSTSLGISDFSKTNLQVITKRNMSQFSQLPSSIAPLFQYASECYLTQGLQFAMEGIHGLGVPWAATIIASGIGLRLLTAPAHIYAEKLFAERLRAQSFLSHEILKRFSKHYNLKLAPNEAGTQLELKTNDASVKAKTRSALMENVPRYLAEHGLQASRIQNLKICSIPIWIFSSFALRNVISGDFHPSVPGALWVPDLLAPDPYFILPVAVGLFGFLNSWSQQKVYGMETKTMFVKSHEFMLGFFTLFAVGVMSQLPACIPLYWLVVSSSGMAQVQLLRHPKIKALFGIHKLPTDSSTPIRDLFKSKGALPPPPAKQ